MAGDWESRLIELGRDRHVETTPLCFTLSVENTSFFKHFRIYCRREND